VVIHSHCDPFFLLLLFLFGTCTVQGETLELLPSCPLPLKEITAIQRVENSNLKLKEKYNTLFSFFMLIKMMNYRSVYYE